MNMVVRVLCAILLAFSALAAASAQSWPVKPVRLIVPGAPGGPPDIRARWLASGLSAALGQAVVPDNRPGAGGLIAMEMAAKSAPDGYTMILVHQGTLAVNPHIYPRLSYDPLRDFAPVTRLVVSAMLLAVPPDSPANSVADLIRLARERPGQLTFGSAGAGTPPHLAAELFKRAAAIDVVHVPYKSAAPAMLDLVAGRLGFTLDGVAIQLPQVRAGKLKALGVSSPQRLAYLPQVPTIAESGVPGFEYWAWMGISLPAGTPAEIVRRLNEEIVKILATAEAREWFAAQGGEPKGETPEQFAAFIRAEHDKWAAVVREAGIKID
jgi:tripartite-type tricarboxylate transporter receptor subunit TctC